MDELSRSWYQTKCRLELRSQQGNAFQDFFASVMELAYPSDFQRIRPYGNQGDQKSDGYRRSTQTLFQVYAPRTMKQARLIAKVQADFDGAVHHWGDRMTSWTFVHNDHDGLPPEALKALQDVEDQYDSVATEIWGPSELESLVLRLSPEHLCGLFGPAPTTHTLDQVRFDRLRAVLTHIKREEPPPQSDIRPVSPEKLEANAFSPDVLHLLRMGRRKEALVGALLSSWPDPGFGEEIAEGFRRRYAELKALHHLSGDEIFGELQAFAGGTDVVKDPAHQAAVLAVLSYFFERCDIFEDLPGAGGT